jgi:hypothetical protein
MDPLNPSPGPNRPTDRSSQARPARDSARPPRATWSRAAQPRTATIEPQAASCPCFPATELPPAHGPATEPPPVRHTHPFYNASRSRARLQNG